MEIQNPSKRGYGEDSPLPAYKKKKPVTRTGFLYLRSLDAPLIFQSADSICNSVCLRSDELYTFGRKNPFCQIAIKDCRISKRHCQIFFDSFDRKIFIVDGFFSSSDSDLSEIRRWFRHRLDWNETLVDFSVRPSLNGVFVNGCMIERGGIVELFVGDEVSFVCRNQPDRIGFVVERSVFTEEIALGHSDAGNSLDLKADRTFKDFSLCGLGHHEVIVRASFLLNKCRGILQSVDPLLYIRKCMNLDQSKEIMVRENGFSVISQKEHFQDPQLYKMADISTSSHWAKNSLCRLNAELNLVNEREDLVNINSVMLHPETVLVSENCSNQIIKSMVSKKMQSVCFSSDSLLERDHIGKYKKKSTSKPDDCPLDSVEKIYRNNHDLHSMKATGIGYSSAGKTFFLNRLEFTEHGHSDQHSVVSLPQLVYPVESLLRVFVATFTSNVLWFLSCCEVPNLLPITIACHNTERCWSASHDKRTTAPYPDYPNLVLLYPPFPEVIAFGKDRKKQGVACHHPKLLVLQREDSVRVIVTSANLVSKQWNNVTNTVWWQDFPRRTTPDYSSLFTHLSCGETSEEKSDFAAQLAGFLAALVADVPSQAHWILELTKYDFGGAVGHLVASIPGMHMKNPPYPSEPMHVLSGKQIACSRSTAMKFLGSVQASVVGLSHRFHTAADSNGTQLKTLAAFLRQCRENGYGMSEVILKRNSNIPADANAVSVLVCDLDEFSEGDYIQLGFLPRNVAKWVAPLCDASFFSFSACIYPKEALAAALGGSNTKVQLMLYVLQGPNFSEIARFIQPEHVPAICSLLASVQRCVGLWRLQEVLCRYKWPESLETDFIYGASSIGTSVNAQFLAAFSAAAGKRSYQFSESEESDPEWGRWNASHELRSPSMRIVFPTIKTVSNGSCGIWPYRRLLSFPEKTWQRLRTAGIFHDAIPHPSDRVGYPMHVKVARRRFQSNTGSLSFGWIYCGSHNFSPAAWGQPTFPSSNTIAGRAVAASDLGARLYICNYELGIIFVVPPPDIISKDAGEKSLDLDDIILPFVVPAPKYGYGDRPATAQAMREALAEVAKLEKEKSVAMTVMDDLVDEEIPDEEEEMVEAAEYVVKENEDEKVYAETLWSQVDQSES